MKISILLKLSLIAAIAASCARPIANFRVEGDSRVPGLSRLPLLGHLFKSRSTTKSKRNLVVFISPTILRDARDAYLETNAKYQYIRELQIGRGGDVMMMPDEIPPAIPPLEEFAPGAARAAEQADPDSTDESDDPAP